MVLTDYKLQAFTLPSGSPFEEVVASLEWQDFSFGESLNGIEANSATVSAGNLRLADILSPQNDVETLVRCIKRDGTEVGNFLCKDAFRTYKDNSEVRFSGPEVSAEMREALIYPYDWVNEFTEVKMPDWEWGTPNTLIENEGFEDGNMSSTSWESGGAEGWEATPNSGTDWEAPDSWSVENDPGNARTGDFVVVVDGDTYHSGIRKRFDAAPGTRITASIWMRSATTGKRLTAGITVSSGYTIHHTNGFYYSGFALAELGNVARNPAGNGLPGGSTNGSWQQINIDVTLGNQTSFYFVAYYDHHDGSDGPVFYIDDFEMSGGSVGFEPWIPRNSTLSLESSFPVRHGVNSLCVVTDGTASNADGLAQEGIEGLELGKTYTLGFWVSHGFGSDVTFTAVIRDDNSGAWLSSAATVVSSTLGIWTYVSVTWIATQPNVRVELRVASASSVTFYVDTTSLATGLPHTTLGDILQLLLAPLQTRGVLDWVKIDSFDAATDSTAASWQNQEVSVRVHRGRTFKQALDLLTDFGLEWDFIWNDGDTTYEFLAYDNSNQGTDKSNTDSGKVFPGSGFISADVLVGSPGANVILAEGESLTFAEEIDGSRIFQYGRREGYKGDTSYMANAQDVADQHMRKQFTRQEVRARYHDIDDLDQWDKFQIGDIFAVDLQPDIDEDLRVAVKRITASRGEKPITEVTLLRPEVFQLST